MVLFSWQSRNPPKSVQVQGNGPEPKQPTSGSHDPKNSTPQGNLVSHTPHSHSSTLLLSQASPKRPLTMSIPPAMLNDPAFSTDPRSHPHFVLDKTVTEPSRSHPKNLSLPRVASGHGSTAGRLRKSPSTPHTFPTVPSPDSVPSSNLSDSLNSRLSPLTPPVPITLPFNSFSHSPQPPPYESLSPQFDTQQYSRPSPTGNTLPDVHKSIETPAQPSGAAATVGGSSVPNSTNRRSLRIHELDRIDELDETDPLGMPWHHGGPYEAIRKAAVEEPTNEKGGFVANFPGRQQQALRSSKISKYVRDGTVGVSLNLVPGQILPRLPYYDSISLVPPHPLCRPPPQSYNRDYDSQQPLSELDSTCYYDPYSELSQQPTKVESPGPDYALQGSQASQRHRHSCAPLAPTNVMHYPDTEHDTWLSQSSPDVTNHKKVAQEKHHGLDASSASPHSNYRQDPEGNRRFSQIPQGLSKMVSFDIPNHVQPPRRPKHVSLQPQGSSFEQYVDLERERRHGTAAILSPDPHDLLPTTVEAVQRTPSALGSTRSKGSLSIGSAKNAPQNRYLPKRLVMPKPLQQDVRIAQSSHRHSPPSSSDSLSQPDRANSQPRAQDIPIFPGSRKLRKKTTVVAGFPNSNPPTLFVPLSINTVSPDLSLHSKDQKNRAPQRVLSKRRSNL